MSAQARMAEVMRDSYGKLLAILASRAGDLLAAEDALSDAFAKALIHWPKEMPRNPEGWLLSVARNRLIDIQRRDARIEFRDDLPEPEQPQTGDEGIPDERLKLMFVCAHPAIDVRMHTPLMLQTVMGLEAEVIARAFLLPRTTMSKRLVRAKRKIRDSAVAFRVPEPDELPGRLSAVLEAIYCAFSRDWMVGDSLAQESLFLAFLLAELLPNNPEALGLAALVAFCLSREDARLQDETFVPLEEQDPKKWNRELIDRATVFLARAKAKNTLGRFQLEAAIQAVHADRLNTGVTDWRALLLLHRGLSALAPTIGATVGYAATLGRAVEPQAGLDALLTIDPAVLAAFAPAQVTQAHFLEQLGCVDEAIAAYDRAIVLTSEPPLRRHLERKRAVLAHQ
ncbi:MAG: DUF6596 domain-containing protein [Myxococcota bacterium]